MKRLHSHSHSKRNPERAGPNPRAGRTVPGALACLTPALALGCATAAGQGIWVAPIEFSDRVPTVEQASQTQLGSLSAPPLLRPSEAERFPLEWGPARFHPYLAYQLAYGDGLLQLPGRPVTTALQTVSPGLQCQLGRFWDLDVAANLNYYSSPQLHDNTGYAAAIRGSIPREEWLFNFNYTGGVSEGVQLDTGTQTPLNSHRAGATATYNYNQRWSVELGLAEDLTLAEGLTDYYVTSTSEWFNYQATPRTTLGLGVGGGYNLGTPGPDSTFEQLLGRISWLPGTKLSVQLLAGVQFQQFFGDSITNSTSTPGSGGGANGSGVFPVLRASASYQLFTRTLLSLNAAQEVGNSYLADQFTETTRVGAGLRQRLLGQWMLTLQTGYSIRKLKESSAGLAPARKDDYLTAYASLGTVLFKRLEVAAFYQLDDNRSSDRAFSFDGTQIGFRLKYRY